MKKTELSVKSVVKFILIVPLILLTLGYTTASQATGKEVKGKVILADSNEPAAGANVIIKGTTIGTVVDRNGKFELRASDDQELTISFVGYTTLLIKVSDITKKPLVLHPRSYEMDLEGIPVQVDKTFTIRAINEREENSPTVVVDGKVVENFEEIDAESIERVEVFKDQDNELVRKYGAENGLIMITTKPLKAESSGDIPPPGDDDEELIMMVEDMPAFRGGESALKSYIYSNLEYPEKAAQQGLEGEVYVEFTIPASGIPEQIKVVKSSDPVFDKAAITVIKNMPSWKPGLQRSKPVPVKIVLPVKFRLSQEESRK